MNEGLKKDVIRRYNEMNQKQHIRIADNFAKRAISLDLILTDLDTILNCLEKIKDPMLTDQTIQNSLWNNLIVTYGKIFTKSQNGFTSLVKKQCIKDEFIKVHDKLVELRNKFVAHREENEIENVLLLVAEDRSDGNVRFEYYIPKVFKINPPIERFDELEGLIKELIKYVTEKLSENLYKIDEKLWDEIENIKRKK